MGFSSPYPFLHAFETALEQGYAQNDKGIYQYANLNFRVSALETLDRATRDPQSFGKFLGRHFLPLALELDFQAEQRCGAKRVFCIASFFCSRHLIDPSLLSHVYE